MRVLWVLVILIMVFVKQFFFGFVESISGFSVILYAYHHILSVEKCMFLLMGFSCIYPQFILIGCNCVYPQSLLIGFSCACLQFIWLDSVVHAYNFFDWIQLNTPANSLIGSTCTYPQFLLIGFTYTYPQFLLIGFTCTSHNFFWSGSVSSVVCIYNLVNLLLPMYMHVV